MQTIRQLIRAAGTGYQASNGGRTFVLQSCDQGNVLTVTLTDAFGRQYTVPGVGPGFKAAPATGFNSVSITTSVDANVAFIVTDGDIDIQETSLFTQITNGPTNRVPVDIGGGTVTVTADNVGINNTSANPVPVSLVSEPGAPVQINGTGSGGTVPVTGTVSVTPTQAATVTDAAPLAVAAFTSGTPNQVHIRAAGACRALRIGNPLTSTGRLYVGGAGVTPTNAVIVLQPGDLWSETDAPQLDWYATSDTGATATMQVIA